MTTGPERAWVIVFGATGFTGRLVCRALRRRNIAFAVAGRNPRKLALLSEALGGVEQCVVDAQSRESVRRALERRLIVCSAAGPFAEVGEPALAAAAEMGVHYADVCREQAFAADGLERYDAVARASRACLVSSMAFESAPADWAASLLAARLGGSLDALDVVYSVRAPLAGLASSRGALRSALATLAHGNARQYVGGALTPESDATFVRKFTTLGGEEITAVSCGGAEAVLAPKHVTVGQVRTFRATTPVAARALQMTRGFAPLLARAGRGALERVLAYASEGPDILTREETRFEIIVEARRGESRARAHLTGADPYALTAEIQAHAAEAALAGYVEASGVVAPSVGYPALAAFASLGDAIHVEMVGDQLAPVRTTKSLRPVRLRPGAGRKSMHSWHTRMA